ncbi:MAG TPA: molybdenum ABC transporter ATP-binding protein, partial [Candidatus Aminicenantes bacterium]|nr:molybdenum ABC transporter ATP-binding protein [Candidatus Aminicenantes bacterium]
LALDPPLMLYDEPLTGLDMQLRDSLLGYLMELPQHLEVQMLYVSHTLGDLLALAAIAGVAVSASLAVFRRLVRR